MASFSFRFHDCSGNVTELESREAQDMAGARSVAIDLARAIMADEVRQGRLCLTCWIVVQDGRGNNLATLQFGDALELGSRDPCHQTRDEALGTAPERSS